MGRLDIGRVEVMMRKKRKRRRRRPRILRRLWRRVSCSILFVAGFLGLRNFGEANWIGGGMVGDELSFFGAWFGSGKRGLQDDY